MKNNILEQEIKVLLSEDEYNRIKCFGLNTENKEIIQINHYFDTNSFFFAEHGMTIRVRQKDNDFTFTIKVTDFEKSNDRIKVSNEYNYKIDHYTFQKMISEKDTININSYQIGKTFENYKYEFAKVRYLGKLTTYRTKFRPLSNLPCIELDENQYLGKVDWELECEINCNKELEQLENWLNGLSIKLFKNERGKNGRFIDSLNSLNNNFI